MSRRPPPLVSSSSEDESDESNYDEMPELADSDSDSDSDELPGLANGSDSDSDSDSNYFPAASQNEQPNSDSDDLPDLADSSDTDSNSDSDDLPDLADSSDSESNSDSDGLPDLADSSDSESDSDSEGLPDLADSSSDSDSSDSAPDLVGSDSDSDSDHPQRATRQPAPPSPQRPQNPQSPETSGRRPNPPQSPQSPQTSSHRHQPSSPSSSNMASSSTATDDSYLPAHIRRVLANDSNRSRQNNAGKTKKKRRGRKGNNQRRDESGRARAIAQQLNIQQKEQDEFRRQQRLLEKERDDQVSLMNAEGLQAISPDADPCASCCRNFATFEDDELIAYLPCKHACCASCLVEWHGICIFQSSEQIFSCMLCRYELSYSVVDDILDEVITHYAPGLLALMDYLPCFDEKSGARNALLRRLLSICKMKIPEAEQRIFEMIESQAPPEAFDDVHFFNDHSSKSESKSKSLSSRQKSEIYENARKRTLELQEEKQVIIHQLEDAYEELNYTFEEVATMKKQIQKLSKQITAARKKAAGEIFQSLNSTHGFWMNKDGSMDHCFDFHGLHVQEAQKKFQELVFPILPVAGVVTIITGKGIHSQGTSSVLKQHLLDFVPNNYTNISIDTSKENSGALVVTYLKDIIKT